MQYKNDKTKPPLLATTNQVELTVRVWTSSSLPVNLWPTMVCKLQYGVLFAETLFMGLHLRIWSNYGENAQLLKSSRTQYALIHDKRRKQAEDSEDSDSDYSSVNGSVNAPHCEIISWQPFSLHTDLYCHLLCNIRWLVLNETAQFHWSKSVMHGHFCLFRQSH